MSTPVKLRLYCSICARNDFYMDRIRAVADGLGLDYTLEKITDDDVIDRMDLLMPCLYAYCPGCRVSKGQTVCLIEAMKMMSEVPAPCDCVIESVCKSNGELVAFGEPLFRYRPC